MCISVTTLLLKRLVSFVQLRRTELCFKHISSADSLHCNGASHDWYLWVWWVNWVIPRGWACQHKCPSQSQCGQCRLLQQRQLTNLFQHRQLQQPLTHTHNSSHTVPFKTVNNSVVSYTSQCYSTTATQSEHSPLMKSVSLNDHCTISNMISHYGNYNAWCNLFICSVSSTL